MYKELLKLNHKKANNTIKNGPKALIDASPKEDTQMENKNMRRCSTGKCRFKQQYHYCALLEWPKSRILTTNAGGNVKWCTILEESLEVFL